MSVLFYLFIVRIYFIIKMQPFSFGWRLNSYKKEIKMLNLRIKTIKILSGTLLVADCVIIVLMSYNYYIKF
jgi:hypothetical protein